VRSSAQREQVARLIAAGLNDCQIERESGVPRRTVSDWRHGRGGLGPAARSIATCVICAGAPERLPTASYAYLLGAYLGDGSLVHTRRGVYRLRVACDLLHVNIALGIALAIEDVRGRRAALQPRLHSRALDVSSYWKHWPCLLPQHGPGRKHARQIALTAWQQRIVDAHPDQLVRGLIHSDGSRYINRIKHPKRTYEYVRYEFSNRSDDIKRIFCDACDALGVQWRVMNRDSISIARRGSVERLDEFIGPKR
jgi:hypothetical protein